MPFPCGVSRRFRGGLRRIPGRSSAAEAAKTQTELTMLGMSRALFWPLVAGAGVIGGWLATQPTGLLATWVAVVLVVLVIFTGSPRLVVWLAGIGVLVDQGQWPIVAGAAGVDIYVGDLLALVAVAASLAQARQRSFWRRGMLLLALLLAWAVLRSDSVGQVAFARILLPLGVMLAVARLLPEGYDLRRDLRWFALAVLISVPLVEGGPASRWTSIAGGANETALIGAIAIALGFTYVGAWRYLLWLVGAALIVGTAGITATIATVAVILYYAVASKRSTVRLGRGSLLLAIWIVLVAVFAVPLLRGDISTTLNAHLFQVDKLSAVLRSGDPVFGTGWTSINLAIFNNTDVIGLHNVYLDVLAYLGAVGLLLLLALLVAIWRRGDVVTRALLVVWIVWVNTTGAFPGTAWGVLAFVLASAAVLHVESEQEPEHRDADAVGGSRRARVDADLDRATRGR